jgi:peptide/nickel transport system ATP-binding protein
VVWKYCARQGGPALFYALESAGIRCVRDSFYLLLLRPHRPHKSLAPRTGSRLPMNETHQVAVRVENVVKSFTGGDSRVFALKGASLEARFGEILMIVGPSGCGKTTLGRTILRLQEPTSGQIIYNGQDITKLPFEQMRQLRKKMQIIFQDPYSSLNPRMTVAQILTEPLVIHGVGSSKTEQLDRAKSLMEKVGLKSQQLNRYPHEFSGGQRQRICIARALMLNPEFVVCDESVSALDVSIQAQVLNLLLDLQQEFKLTYIFISHDLSVINFISDFIGVMNAGKIIEMGSAKKIYERPENDYTKTLLSAIPRGYPKNIEAFIST